MLLLRPGEDKYLKINIGRKKEKPTSRSVISSKEKESRLREARELPKATQQTR